MKKSEPYIFHAFSDLPLKDVLHALLSWDKADLEHKIKGKNACDVPEMINGKEKRALSKEH